MYKLYRVYSSESGWKYHVNSSNMFHFWISFIIIWIWIRPVENKDEARHKMNTNQRWALIWSENCQYFDYSYTFQEPCVWTSQLVIHCKNTVSRSLPSFLGEGVLLLRPWVRMDERFPVEMGWMRQIINLVVMGLPTLKTETLLI